MSIVLFFDGYIPAKLFKMIQKYSKKMIPSNSWRHVEREEVVRIKDVEDIIDVKDGMTLCH